MTYRVLTADPPWRHKDKLPGKRGASSHYSTLSLREIMEFPLPPMLDPSVLFLWRVASMQEEALQVAKAWGFTPKTEVVWVKMRVCSTCKGETMVAGDVLCHDCVGQGEKLHNGLGHHVRGAHEVCLICTRGAGLKKLRLNADVPSVFWSVPPKVAGGSKVRHSAKPGAFYSYVERLYPGPYCELFARNKRDGWTTMGDEL